MIPKDYITAWRAHAPWRLDAQVEQDLVISRAIVDLFSVPEVASSLVYRFESEDAPPLKLRLKVEINTREHFTKLGIKRVPFRQKRRPQAQGDRPWPQVQTGLSLV